MCVNGVWILNRVLWVFVINGCMYNVNFIVNVSVSWMINEICESNMNVFFGLI